MKVLGKSEDSWDHCEGCELSGLYPFLLDPLLHTKVWGGRRLDTIIHKELPTEEPYGESWELHDEMTVINGPLSGRTLGSLLVECGHKLIGRGNDPEEGFPIMVKLIDVSEWVSIQVHPNDEQAHALENEPRGKSEVLYILAAQPGSRLVIGVKPGTTERGLSQAILESRMEDHLVYADVEQGDCVYIPAGAIHASGSGILLYEIQQSSDITYRLYDWGRVDLDGKQRELHTEKGIAVANLEILLEIKHTARDIAPTVKLVNTLYFTTLLHRLNIDNGLRVELDTEGDRFHFLTCIEGKAGIIGEGESGEIKTGQSVLIPASLGKYELGGTAQILRSFT